jgi:hypothetical protein
MGRDFGGCVKGDSAFYSLGCWRFAYDSTQHLLDQRGMDNLWHQGPQHLVARLCPPDSDVWFLLLLMISSEGSVAGMLTYLLTDTLQGVMAPSCILEVEMGQDSPHNIMLLSIWYLWQISLLLPDPPQTAPLHFHISWIISSLPTAWGIGIISDHLSGLLPVSHYIR